MVLGNLRPEEPFFTTKSAKIKEFFASFALFVVVKSDDL